MSRFSPISQWGFGVNVNCLGSPTMRTTGLSFSSLPNGVVGLGMLGMLSWMSRIFSSMSRMRSSMPLISSAILRISSIWGDASCFRFFRLATSCVTLFRCCLSRSPSTRHSRHSRSSCRSWSRGSVLMLRLTSASLTTSGLFLMNFSSNMLKTQISYVRSDIYFTYQ